MDVRRPPPVQILVFDWPCTLPQRPDRRKEMKSALVSREKDFFPTVSLPEPPLLWM
jgi:hypothetical protein